MYIVPSSHATVLREVSVESSEIGITCTCETPDAPVGNQILSSERTERAKSPLN